MRLRRIFNPVLFATLASLFMMGASMTVLAVNPDDLRSAIDEKARQLDEVTKQLQQAQDQLSDAAVQGKTLKAEVSRIDNTVQKVNLNIKVSELTIDKLGLEIRSLQGDISSKEKMANLKRETVSQLLQAYQQKERQSLLISFLNGESLADSIAEAQNINDLNNGLLQEVGELLNLKQELADRLGQVSGKKQSIEQENSSLKAKKSIAQEQLAERQRLLAETKNREDNYKKLVTDLEKQQQSISDEINDIEESLRAQGVITGLPDKRRGVLARPVAKGTMTQEYGVTSFSRKLYKSGFHNGVDFGVPVGTEVFAADDGVVLRVGFNGLRLQYGRYIVVKHGNGLVTLYAHLSKQVVATGEKVTRGQVIGYSGNTGYSTGAHLHLTVYYEPDSCNAARAGRSECVQFKNTGAAGLVPVGVTVDPTDYL